MEPPFAASFDLLNNASMILNEAMSPAIPAAIPTIWFPPLSAKPALYEPIPIAIDPAIIIPEPRGLIEPEFGLST